MKRKKKGNVLIITLVVFMVLTFHLVTFLHLQISHVRNIQSLKQVDHERIVTNSIIAYIKYVQKNDILLSDYIEGENYTIHYTVDDMGDYFYIEVSFTYEDNNVKYNFDLNREKNYITRFEYMNEY
ncbi:MAG: hypothetical protein ACI4SR_10255 [Faecalibacillus sp.]